MIGKALLVKLRRQGQAQVPDELALSARMLGQHCERLLNDSVLRLVFELLEEDFTQQMVASGVGTSEARDQREAWHAMIAALHEVDGKMRQLMGEANTLDLEEEIERRRAAE